MSDFGEVMDAILQGVQTAISGDTVELHRGFKHPGDVTLNDTNPVFCMVYNPVEDPEALDDAQFDLVVTYQMLLLRSQQPSADLGSGIRGNPAFDAMADDLDAVKNWLLQSWPADPGPLGGVVHTVAVGQRLIDDFSDGGKVIGELTVITGELT